MAKQIKKLRPLKGGSLAKSQFLLYTVLASGLLPLTQPVQNGQDAFILVPALGFVKPSPSYVPPPVPMVEHLYKI